MVRTIAVVLVLVACGGTQAPHAEDEQHDAEKMSPELAKFHDVLAPRWHAAKGPLLISDSCAAIPDFRAGVVAIATAAAPAGIDADAWNNGTAMLAHAVDDLDKACQGNDPAGFEDAFAKVHQGFHGLMGEH